MTRRSCAAPTSRRRLVLAAAALPAAALVGCAAQTAALRQAPPPDLPRRRELDDVPFHPQLDYQCGPAALATALGHLGVEVAPERLAQQVFLPARGGTLQLEMLAGARRHGVVATRVAPTVEALLRELAAGHAVVVLQNLALSFAPRWHYAVLVGFDLERPEVVLRSGTTRREMLALRTFEHTWRRAAHWAFVALPPGRWPVTASREDALEAAIGFERVAAPASSARVYRSALERWPDDYPLTMGLGNALAADGRWRDAADAFRAAALRHAQAPAWINLSTALLQLGETDAANEAAEQAVRHADERWAAQARQAADAARDAIRRRRR